LASVEGAKLGAVLPNGLLLTGATVWESDKRARVAFVRWVYGVGFFPVKASATGQGSAGAVKSALARCQVVGRVILGLSLVDACALSGWSSVKKWVESCKAAGFFASLRAARLASALDSAQVEAARVAQRRFALQAAACVRALAGLGGGGWRDVCDTSTQRGRGARARRVVGLVMRRRQLLRDLAANIALAKHYKAMARQALADTLAAFDRVCDKLHSDKWGDLRQVLGMMDKRGRGRGAGKVNSAMIRKASGKLARAVNLCATVALPVGGAKPGKLPRKRPCAMLAGAAV
jgi:hypothetical protein